MTKSFETSNKRTNKKGNIFKNFLYNKRAFICIMLFPMIFHLIVFWLGVQIESLKVAFFNGTEFTLEYFSSVIRSITTKDGIVVEALTNTFRFALLGFLNIPLGIFFGYMIWRGMKGYKFVRLALYLPVSIGGFMLAILYQQLFSTDGPMIKLLNDIMHLNIATPVIMENPIPLIMSFDILTGVGGNLIIWLGSMGRIPHDLLEAASLDGITTMQEFTKIVFPLIFPTFTTVFTLQIVGVLGASGSIMIFTEGNYGTFTLSYWLYHVAYKGQTNTYGIAGAMGILMTLVTLPLVVIGRIFINKFGGEVEY